MDTIDSILSQIANSTSLQLVETRDKRVLISMAKQLQSGAFLTKNQGSLLLKILKENQQHLNVNVDFESPLWSKPFRVIEQIRTITVNNNTIVINFTFNKKLRDLMAVLSKEVTGFFTNSATKTHTAPLTEENIYLVLSMLKSYQFKIDDTLKSYYEEITKIKQSNNDYFKFENLNEKIRSKIEKHIDVSNDLLLADRRIMFQYFSDNAKGTSLSAKIANRKSSRIYIDPINSIESVFSALSDLKRFPVMLVFNQHNLKDCVQLLNNILPELKKRKTGVYFRFDGKDAEFNNIVKENNLNQRLDNTTEVVIISHNQLPKFLIKEKWVPESVIAFSTSFTNSKVSVYCEDVDLVIYYSPQKPIIGTIDELV
jgi:hypothetical protein